MRLWFIGFSELMIRCRLFMYLCSIFMIFLCDMLFCFIVISVDSSEELRLLCMLVMMCWCFSSSVCWCLVLCSWVFCICSMEICLFRFFWSWLFLVWNCLMVFM